MSAVWRAPTSSRSATTAWRAAAAASAAGTFSKPLVRSSTRSSPGNGLRQRVPLRTSSTPTPAGPPHLWAEAAAAAQPWGSGRRPAEAQASTKSGTSGSAATTSASGCTVPTSWLADCTAATATPGADAARDSASTSTRPSRSTGTTTLSPPAQAAACSTAECSTAEWTTVEPTRARPGAQPEQPAVDGVGAGRGERDLVGAHVQAGGDRLAGVVEQDPRRPAGSVQAAGIGVPLVERGPQDLAGGGVQRLGRRGVEVDRGDRRRAGPGDARGPTGGFCHTPNLVHATPAGTGATHPVGRGSIPIMCPRYP